jgi:hypothetical protein
MSPDPIDPTFLQPASLLELATAAAHNLRGTCRLTPLVRSVDLDMVQCQIDILVERLEALVAGSKV